MNVGEVIVLEANPGASYGAFWAHTVVAIDIICGMILITPIFRTREHIQMANSDGRGTN